MPTVKREESIRGFFLNIAILRCRPRHGQAAGSSRGGWWLRYNPVARSTISRFVNPADRRAEARAHKLENCSSCEVAPHSIVKRPQLYELFNSQRRPVMIYPLPRTDLTASFAEWPLARVTTSEEFKWCQE